MCELWNQLRRLAQHKQWVGCFTLHARLHQMKVDFPSVTDQKPPGSEAAASPHRSGNSSPGAAQPFRCTQPPGRAMGAGGQPGVRGRWCGSCGAASSPRLLIFLVRAVLLCVHGRQQ
mmetsp:Transcript_2786/g.7860  ORF Transcript_2786/g.7860 Transcript_2786/m.7860 type:complete len:117 (+) Transcript_2786:215-565(+)